MGEMRGAERGRGSQEGRLLQWGMMLLQLWSQLVQLVDHFVQQLQKQLQLVQQQKLVHHNQLVQWEQ